MCICIHVCVGECFCIPDIYDWLTTTWASLFGSVCVCVCVCVLGEGERDCERHLSTMYVSKLGFQAPVQAFPTCIIIRTCIIICICTCIYMYTCTYLSLFVGND